MTIESGKRQSVIYYGDALRARCNIYANVIDRALHCEEESWQKRERERERDFRGDDTAREEEENGPQFAGSDARRVEVVVAHA